MADLQEAMKKIGNQERATQQRAYMRGKFQFYGISMPILRRMLQRFGSERGVPTGAALHEFAAICYEQQQREMHYAAIYFLEKRVKKETLDMLPILEHLILQHSWWDTVDWLASICGQYFMLHPIQKATKTQTWIKSENIWLQWVAIIFQLKYKSNTDEEMLYEYIQQIADSDEFFLQKAAGWALRQYSKTNPLSVSTFLAATQLSPLTVREGSKYL